MCALFLRNIGDSDASANCLQRHQAALKFECFKIIQARAWHFSVNRRGKEP